MTVNKINLFLDRIEQELDLIGIAVNASEVRQGYSPTYKVSAVKWIREAQDKIKLAMSELDRLRF